MSTEEWSSQGRSAVKLQVAEPLKAVMAEAATQNYIDRFGAPLSPASVVAGGLPVRGGAVRNSKDAVDKWIWGLGLGI